MKKLLSTLTLISIGLFLTACGPIYNTEYSYVPPKSKIGKMCISQCQQNKMMCEQMNASRKDACLSKARQDALYEFEIYKLQREKEKKSIDKTPRSFERTWQCNQDSQCKASFNSCYTTCGGDIYERKVCTAFCDKQ